jgi:hypothetical protein
MMKKIEVKESINSFSASELDGKIISTPEDAWHALIGHVDREKYKSFYIDYDYGYNESYSGSFAVYGVRDETNEEFESRCKKESDMRAREKIRKRLEKEKKEVEERALLEKLKKKYE